MYDGIVYSEVSSFLSVLDKKYLLKIPRKFIESIEKSKDINYHINYDLDIPLYKQKISKEAISIIALIHLKYWCKNDQEREELYKIFENNFRILEEQKNKMYSYNKLFKNEKKYEEDFNNGKNEKDMEIMPYKESTLKKIIDYIKNVFSRKK